MTITEATSASLITEDIQTQNGTRVKWYQIDGMEYTDNGVYGIYDDGAVVDSENYPVEEDISINEIMESVESAGI